MKKSAISLGAIFFSLMALEAWAERADKECTPTGSTLGPSVGVSKLANDASKILKKIDEPKLVGTYDKATSKTCSAIEYKIPDRKLNPGEALEFAVPESYRDRGVAFVILGHRQEPSDSRGAAGQWDDYPGYTSVQIHSDKIPQDPWRFWGGPHSGPKGAKFAEIGSQPEIENLYEWRKFGHQGVEKEQTSKEPLYPDRVRVVANGTDPVHISQLTLKVSPPRAEKYMDAVFSSGTVLGDAETAAGRTYGGGQGFKGKFPGALALGGWGSSAGEVKLPEGWKIVGGELHIPVKAGLQITSVDVACGDSHPDEITNDDGGYGTKGWSKLSIGLKKKDGAVDWMMNRDNVPPEGVLSGSPSDCGYATSEGDEVVIRADSDTAYLMGLRIGLKKKINVEHP